MEEKAKDTNQFKNVLIIGSRSHISQFLAVANQYCNKDAVIQFDYDEDPIPDLRPRRVYLCDELYVVNADQYISPKMADAIDQALQLDKKVVYFENQLANKLPVITICGSAKFKTEIRDLAEKLMVEGNIVLTPHIFEINVDSIAMLHGVTTSYMHNILDRIHQWKILRCDKVLVANFHEYFGENTREEIIFAREHGKPVEFLMPYVSQPGSPMYFEEGFIGGNIDE